MPVILLITIQIEADIVNLLANTRLDTVTFVIAKQVIIFMLIVLLGRISKAVVTTGGVAITGQGEVCVGGIHFARVKQAIRLAGAFLIIIELRFRDRDVS
ncbi:hypothetical protein D3C78_949020 [compost metagenome]